MKHKFILSILLIAGICFSKIQAQVKQVSIIDDLETFVPDEGIIRISSDPKIIELIGLLSPDVSVSNTDYLKANGFRVQVVMSNNPRTARKEIDNKGNIIKETFPEIGIYKGYTAPNWKLLVGDFLTKSDADAFKEKMLKSIPELGKEMYIVPDKINVPVQ